MNKKLIIFDLDGTLIDTSEGIFHSVRYAEEKMGFQPISEQELRKFVGPPPKEVYKQLYGVEEAEALEAVKYHREYGSTKAIFEAKLYYGIDKLLQELKMNGYLLAVATLKKEEIAKQVLKECDIYHYFDTISGMNEAETLTKAMTIKEVWKRLEYYGDSILIGDTLYDYEGAKEVGINFIGVTYGFGFQEGKFYQFKVANSTTDILNHILTESNKFSTIEM